MNRIFQDIAQVISSKEVSIEDLIGCIELVKHNGEVVVIKFDGERHENHYTAFITFPVSTKKEMIRADESSLKEALLKVLKAYTRPV